MPIPKEILSVKRPVNTIVIIYGKNKDRFAVRQRIGCRRANGRNVPINAHHRAYQDGVFIPLEETSAVKSSGIDLKDWADIILCDRLFSPMIEELEEVCEKRRDENLLHLASEGATQG